MVSTLYVFLTRVMVSKGQMGTAPRGPDQHQGRRAALKQSPPQEGKNKL